jgi:ArsR family metal-binding transcriptional regulator
VGYYPDNPEELHPCTASTEAMALRDRELGSLLHQLLQPLFPHFQWLDKQLIILWTSPQQQNPTLI